MPRTNISLRLSAESLEIVDGLAKEHRVTRVDVIRMMLRHGLEPTRAELKRRQISP